MNIKRQNSSFVENFLVVVIFSGFLLSLFMIVTGIILSESHNRLLIIGLALFSIYIAAVIITRLIEKLQVRSLQKKRFYGLVSMLKKPDLELEKLVQIVKVFTRSGDRRAISYILEVFKELLDRIDKKKGESLNSLSFAIIPIIDNLVALKANTAEAQTLLSRLLKLARREGNETEAAAGTLTDGIRDAASQAVEQLSRDPKIEVYPEVNKRLPWDIEPLTGLKKVVAYVAVLSLIFFSFLIPVFILATLRKSYTVNSIYFISGCVVSLTLIIFAIKSFSYLNRRLELPRLEKFTEEWGSKSSVYHMFSLSLRGFEEFSKIQFQKDGLRISGTLTPGWLPIIIFVIFINIILVALNLVKNYEWFIYELCALIPAVLIYYVIGKRRRTITIRPGNIRKVSLRGPFVTIKFINAPVSQLKRLKFFVPPSFRLTFFNKFDILFPGTLPEPYRIALKYITSGGPSGAVGDLEVG